jgi:hypothetical protein
VLRLAAIGIGVKSLGVVDQVGIPDPPGRHCDDELELAVDLVPDAHGRIIRDPRGSGQSRGRSTARLIPPGVAVMI